jgi:predicted pyridoxine 5'-phosphate oxidase superfamily flavin-nucleotide-binding protein
MRSYGEVAFTTAVQALQEHYGSRAAYARLGKQGEAHLSAAEAEFLAAADSFYLATVGETGWPYVQHRGGPRGFLRRVSATRLAFADFRGNRQYVSAGNASVDSRASILVMDYAARRRLKLFGRLGFQPVESAEAGLASAVALSHYAGRVERIAVFDVEAFDWNCPQHITQRFTVEQVETLVEPLRRRIAQLEAELRTRR